MIEVSYTTTSCSLIEYNKTVLQFFLLLKLFDVAILHICSMVLQRLLSFECDLFEIVCVLDSFYYYYYYCYYLIDISIAVQL